MEKKDNALKALRITRVFRCIGPAIIIAASIIGPGTVTTASSTGAEYGYALLWCSVISAILAYILNEPGLRWTLKTRTTNESRSGKGYFCGTVCWSIGLSDGKLLRGSYGD